MTFGTGNFGSGTFGDPSTLLPAAPTNLAATLIESNRIDLIWNDTATNEDAYTVERSPGGAGTWAVLTSTLPANTTTYSDPALAHDTAYDYRVRATNSIGPSSYSNTLSVSTLVETEPPVVVDPPGITVTGATPTSLTVNWTTDKPTDGQVEYGTTTAYELGFSAYDPGPSLSHAITLTGLAPETTYFFQVISTTAGGVLSITEESEGATTAPDPAAVPAAPTGLAAVSGAASPPYRIDLTWTDASADETGFAVERATSAAGPFSQIADLPAGTEAHSDVGLPASATRYYRVAAYNANGPSAYSTTASATTPAAAPTAPAAPTGLAASLQGLTSVLLTWTDTATDEAGFHVERSPAGAGTWVRIASPLANDQDFVDGGLPYATSWDYRVQAHNAGGVSAYTSTVSATTADAPPEGSAAERHVAVPRIEVAWTDDRTGIAVVGTSTVGGSDVVSGGFGANVFDDITADVMSVRITRGATGTALNQVQAGRCTLELTDPDGTYNPENPASPLYDYLLPLRPVRVTQVWQGTPFVRFHGFVTRIEHDPAPTAQRSRIEAVDLLEWLANARPLLGDAGPLTVGACLGRLLDDLGWTDLALRQLDAGGVVPLFGTDGATASLRYVEALAAVDLGRFFVKGDGTVTYHARGRRHSPTAPLAATLTGTMVGAAKPSSDLRRIVTRQAVTRLPASGTGQGTTQTVADEGEARQRYGTRDGQPIASRYLLDDFQAGGLAGFLVALQRDPRPPTAGIRLTNRDDASIQQQLQREIGDLVAFTEPRGGTDTTGWIEGIDESITHGGTIHVTQYTLSKRSFSMAVVGTSTVGGSDGVGY